MQLTKQLLHTTDTYIQKLLKGGIVTVQDFLLFFPRSIEDRRTSTSKFSMADISTKVSMSVRIVSITTEMTQSKKHLTKAIISDSDNICAEAVWFGQRLVSQRFSSGDDVQLYGKVKYEYGKFVFLSPEILPEEHHGDDFLPVYSDWNYIPGTWFREKMKFLKSYISLFSDILPESIRKKKGFRTRSQNISALHFPKDISDFQRAQRELGYEELFEFQFNGISKKILQRGEYTGRAIPIPLHAECVTRYLSLLPFSLTNKQKIVLFQILKDMESSYPMARLLQGDVGTGKTLVVFLAALHALSQKKIQVAFLVPTEILAQQHAKSFLDFFPDSGVRLAVLTGSTSTREKERIKGELKNGNIDFLIGTHALIQDSVQFSSLGLVIIDEQHRFGVEQRRALEAYASGTQGILPHTINMTATPIPRTLTLTFFGDQDVSILNEYPVGRKPIITQVVSEDDRNQVYRHVEYLVGLGQQIYWISPLVRESDTLEVANATQMHELLTAIFPNLRVGLIHGKMKSREKEQIMKDFIEKKIDILSSTSVIEVGVNNPNATVMCIEGAERFGLSSLHQFRGRVGRGNDQSYCFLFTTKPFVGKRLKALETSNDGFELSEIDLEIRGPGEVYGVRQSGVPDLKLADLRDIETIETIRNDIQEYYSNLSSPPGK